MKKQMNKIEWKEVELKELGELIMGQSPKGATYNSEKKGVPLLNGAGDIKNNQITAKQFTTKPTKLSKKGDILFCIRATIGKSITSDGEYCLGRGVAGFRVNKKLLEARFLLKILDKKLKELVPQGSTIVGVKGIDIEKIKISLPFSNGKPDIKEQERIVSILEKAEKVKVKGDNAGKLLDEYLKSVFNEMFYRKGFEEVKLGREGLFEDIFAGGDVQKVNLSKIKTDKYKFPIFTNGEKNKGLYGYTDTPRVTKPSITISARGTIGYSEIRMGEFYPAIRLIVITPKKDVLNLHFLKYALNNTEFDLKGTSIPQLTVPMIKGYKIPLPPIALQQKFAKIVEHVEKMKGNIKKTKQNSKELFDSLMSKAFRGEL